DVRAEVVRAFVDGARRSGHAGQGDDLLAAGYCETDGHEIAFANSGGQQLWGRTTRAAIDGIQRAAGADGGAQQIAARVGDLDGAATGRRAAGKARQGRDPVEVDPGPWEVV